MSSRTGSYSLASSTGAARSQGMYGSSGTYTARTGSISGRRGSYSSLTGDYGSGRSTGVSGSRYNTNSLDRADYSSSLQRSSSIAGSRNSVERYTTGSLSRSSRGYTPDYSSLSMSSSFGAGYSSKYNSGTRDASVDRPTYKNSSWSRESSVEPSYTSTRYGGARAMSTDRDYGLSASRNKLTSSERSESRARADYSNHSLPERRSVGRDTPSDSYLSRRRSSRDYSYRAGSQTKETDTNSSSFARDDSYSSSRPRRRSLQSDTEAADLNKTERNKSPPLPMATTSKITPNKLSRYSNSQDETTSLINSYKTGRRSDDSKEQTSSKSTWRSRLYGDSDLDTGTTSIRRSQRASAAYTKGGNYTTTAGETTDDGGSTHLTREQRRSALRRNKHKRASGGAVVTEHKETKRHHVRHRKQYLETSSSSSEEEQPALNGRKIPPDRRTKVLSNTDDTSTRFHKRSSSHDTLLTAECTPPSVSLTVCNEGQPSQDGADLTPKEKLIEAGTAIGGDGSISTVEKSIAKVKAWQERIVGGSDEEDENTQRKPKIRQKSRSSSFDLLDGSGDQEVRSASADSQSKSSADLLEDSSRGSRRRMRRKRSKEDLLSNSSDGRRRKKKEKPVNKDFRKSALNKSDLSGIKCYYDGEDVTHLVKLCSPADGDKLADELTQILPQVLKETDDNLGITNTQETQINEEILPIEKPSMPFGSCDCDNPLPQQQYSSPTEPALSCLHTEARGSPEGASLPDHEDTTVSHPNLPTITDKTAKETALSDQCDFGNFMTQSLPVFPTNFDEFRALETVNLSIQSLQEQINAVVTGEVIDPPIPPKNGNFLSPDSIVTNQQGDDMSDSSYATPDLLFADATDQLINLEALEGSNPVTEKAGESSVTVHRYDDALANELDIWECGEVDLENGQEMTYSSNSPASWCTPTHSMEDLSAHHFSEDSKSFAQDGAIEMLGNGEMLPISGDNAGSLKSEKPALAALQEVDLLTPEAVLHCVESRVMADRRNLQEVTLTPYMALPVIKEAVQTSYAAIDISTCQISEAETEQEMDIRSTTSEEQEMEIQHSDVLEIFTELLTVWNLTVEKAKRKYVSIVERRCEPRDLHIQPKQKSAAAILEISEVAYQETEKLLGMAFPKLTQADRVRLEKCQTFEMDVFNCGELWKEGEICEEFVELHQATRPNLYRRASELPRHPRTRYDHTQVLRLEVFYSGNDINLQNSLSIEAPYRTLQYADIREVILAIPQGTVVEYFHTEYVRKTNTCRVPDSRVYHKPVYNWVYKHQVKTYDAKELPNKKQDKKVSTVSLDISEKPKSVSKIVNMQTPEPVAGEQKISRVEAVKEKVKIETQKIYSMQEVKVPESVSLPKSVTKQVLSQQNKQSSYHKFEELDQEEKPSTNNDTTREERRKAKLDKVERELVEQGKERDLARQKAAEARKKLDEEREAQKAAVRSEAQRLLKQRFEQQSQPPQTEPHKYNNKPKTNGTTAPKLIQKPTEEKKIETKKSPVDLPQESSKKIVNSFLSKTLPAKALRTAQSEPNLLSAKNLNGLESKKVTEEVKFALQEDQVSSSDTESSLADSQSVVSDTPYDSDSSSTSTHTRSTMYRPSSKWDLGGDIIHEDEVFEADSELGMRSLPRSSSELFKQHDVDLTRWQSTDRLKSLCKGIDLNQATDDEMSMSQLMPRSSHRKESRSHHRTKPWLNVCKTILTTKGSISTKELVDICEKKKAHFTARQDHDFEGFETIDEMLDCMGVAIEKLSECADTLKRSQTAGPGNYVGSDSSVPEPTGKLLLSIKACILKDILAASDGRELRRVVLSLKIIFQSEADFAAEFLAVGGIDSLLDLDATVDDQQNQISILKALGQILLYTFGITALIGHQYVVKWLYSKMASLYRLVVRTTLKLLLAFVEYTKANAVVLYKAVCEEDKDGELLPFYNVVDILDKDSDDGELCTLALALLNMVAGATTNTPTFKEVKVTMERHGIRSVLERINSQKSKHKELVENLSEFCRHLGIQLTRPSRKSAAVAEETIQKQAVTPRPNEEIMVTEQIPDGLRDSGYDTLKGESCVVNQEDSSSVSPGNLNNARWKKYALTNKKSQEEQETEVINTSTTSPIATGVVSLMSNKITSPTEETPITPELSKPVHAGHIENIKNRITQTASVTMQSRGQMQQERTNHKKTDTDQTWESLERLARTRMLKVKDIDFTDLDDDDDIDILMLQSATNMDVLDHARPPPPPPMLGGPPLPPPPPGMGPPAPPGLAPPPPAAPPMSSTQTKLADAKKQKKLLRLHWKEVKDKVHIPNPTPQLQKLGTIWQRLQKPNMDMGKFEVLFETRSTDNRAKESEKVADGGSKYILVLDSKRSNAINIGLTKLPPPRTIRTAVLKMDHTIINREGVEKILTTMIPTQDEVQAILDAKTANPDKELGTAENLLMTLSSIHELVPRLHLWVFTLDYSQREKEIAEPLHDLKDGISAIEESVTFQQVLSMLLSIGNVLNGSQSKGFHIEYLSKVAEIKDTQQRQSLLYHLCHTILETYPNSSDLYSELAAIARCSREDFNELPEKLTKLKADCIQAMDNLSSIVRHESLTTQNIRRNLADFLHQCAEKICVLQTISTRVQNRYHKLLLYLGIAPSGCKELKIQDFCKTITEFSLEYKITREKILLQQAISMKRAAEKRKQQQLQQRRRASVDTKNIDKSAREVRKAEDQLHNLLKDGYASDSSLKSSKTKKRMTVDQSLMSSFNNSKKNLKGKKKPLDDLESVLEGGEMSASSIIQRPVRSRARQQHRELRRTLSSGNLSERRSRSLFY